MRLHNTLLISCLNLWREIVLLHNMPMWNEWTPFSLALSSFSPRSPWRINYRLVLQSLNQMYLPKINFLLPRSGGHTPSSTLLGVAMCYFGPPPSTNSGSTPEWIPHRKGKASSLYTFWSGCGCSNVGAAKPRVLFEPPFWNSCSAAWDNLNTEQVRLLITFMSEVVTCLDPQIGSIFGFTLCTCLLTGA